MTDQSHLEKIAQNLELHRAVYETEQEFKFRVAFAYLDRYGGAYNSVEIITGKNHRDFNEEENSLAFLLNFANAQAKRRKYAHQKDTHFQMSWKEFENVVGSNGFSKVISYDFKNPSLDAVEHYCVWVETKNAFLLTAESYWGRKVNSTGLYYELSVQKDQDDFSRMIFNDALEGGSSKNFYDDLADPSSFVCIVQKDAREGLVEHIKKVTGSGLKTNNPWKAFNEHFLCLCDFSESRGDYDHKAIKHKKMQQLPQATQAMFGYQPKK